MTNYFHSSNYKKKFGLEKRTAALGEATIEFASSFPDTAVNWPLISQVVRSGISVGANYMEADAANQKKDFNHKIAISRKEAKETLRLLRMIVKANASKADAARGFWQETHELVLIFSSMLCVALKRVYEFLILGLKFRF